MIKITIKNSEISREIFREILILERDFDLFNHFHFKNVKNCKSTVLKIENQLFEDL